MASIKAEYINPFISNALEVFEQLANIELKKSEVKLKSDPTPGNDVSIIVGVAGFIEGQVVYSLKQYTAERIAMQMITDPKKQQDKEMLKSAIAELANVITGRATINLSGRDKVLSITPPVVIIGKDYNIELVKLETIAAYFTSRFGTIEINIALREKQGK
jgi:chemotaxis protein CheX